MPDREFGELVRRYGTFEFSWLIPDVEMLGGVVDIGNPTSRDRNARVSAVYLSPLLERSATSTVIAVVGEALATLVLGERDPSASATWSPNGALAASPSCTGGSAVGRIRTSTTNCGRGFGAGRLHHR